MAETAAYLVDNVIPHVPVRQWVLSFPIPLRSLLAIYPELLTPVLRIVHRAIHTHRIRQAKVKRNEAASGAVTLIQRFGRLLTRLGHRIEEERIPYLARNDTLDPHDAMAPLQAAASTWRIAAGPRAGVKC